MVARLEIRRRETEHQLADLESLSRQFRTLYEASLSFVCDQTMEGIGAAILTSPSLSVLSSGQRQTSAASAHETTTRPRLVRGDRSAWRWWVPGPPAWRWLTT